LVIWDELPQEAIRELVVS